MAADRDALAEQIVAGLLCGTELAQRDPAQLLDRWRAGVHTLGREVWVVGVAVDIGPDGALVVQTAAGLRQVRAGDVQGVAT